MLLASLIDQLPIESPDAPSGAAASVRPEITSVVEDSRAVTTGALFVARRGVSQDGRGFIQDAIDRGAAAVLTDRSVPALPADTSVVHLRAEDVPGCLGRLAERFNGDPSRQLHLVGITGTNGKTTVATLIRAIMRSAGHTCGLLGTVEIDDGRAPYESSLTTPAAPELSATFARMVANKCKHAVMEVSSHALDQARVDGLRFRGAAFTNLTGDHLDYHGSMGAYAAAKRRLFSAIDPGGFAVVNIDDPSGESMARAALDAGARVLRCTLDGGSEAEARGAVTASSVEGMVVALDGPWGRVAVRVPLAGRHNAMNILQAVAVAFQLGVRSDILAGALSRAAAPPGRLERVDGPTARPAVFVDYAHTDDALANVLQAARSLVPEAGRLWVVFGCGGDRDRSKRPRMARAALRGADRIVVTSDNPRTEDPTSIVDEILTGVPLREHLRVNAVVDRREAIASTINSAGADDVVIIAGKGHEDYQIIGTTKFPFDDRLIAGEVLVS